MAFTCAWQQKYNISVSAMLLHSGWLVLFRRALPTCLDIHFVTDVGGWGLVVVDLLKLNHKKMFKKIW